MATLYEKPEEYGYRLFEEIDEEGLSYEFNTFVILEIIQDRALFWMKDSGCSCPSPFEGKDANDLNPIKCLRDFEGEFDEWRKPYPDHQRCSPDEKQKVLAKVKKHIWG